MSRRDDLQKLINLRQRRLQKLKEQQANPTGVCHWQVFCPNRSFGGIGAARFAVRRSD